MKKLLAGGLIWAGLVCSGAAMALPSLQSCAVCSSPSAWTGPVGGPYQCSGGDGGKGVHGPGVTCTAFPNSGGYSVKGMNGSLNFTVDASPISPAACAQTFSLNAVPLCYGQYPATWIPNHDATSYQSGPYKCKSRSFERGVVFFLTVNRQICPNNTDVPTPTTCTQCVQAFYPNG